MKGPGWHRGQGLQPHAPLLLLPPLSQRLADSHRLLKASGAPRSQADCAAALRLCAAALLQDLELRLSASVPASPARQRSPSV